jgi:hypothetical protein
MVQNHTSGKTPYATTKTAVAAARGAAGLVTCAGAKIVGMKQMVYNSTDFPAL